MNALFTNSNVATNSSCDLINGYLSTTSHQLNATMCVLMGITAIFIALGFLARVLLHKF